jgi:type IV secretion system protein VirB5
MKKNRQTVLAALLAVTMLVAGSLPARASGIPVVDVANLAQSVMQVLSWMQQIQDMSWQLQRQKQQLEAITGSRNMGSLLHNLGLMGIVPYDASLVYESIRRGGINGLSQAARVLRHNRMLYNCANKTGDALRICHNILNQSPQNLANIDGAYQLLLKRAEQIRDLTTSVNAAQDEKASLDLIARIGAEQAAVSNQTNQLLTLKMMAEETKEAARQEHMEYILNLTSPERPSSFSTMPPWTP